MEKNQELDGNGIVFKNLPQDKTVHLIKVIGVGGAGGNAVKNMYQMGIKNVGFAICNTDSQALHESPIPIQVQLGSEGLGVGGDPKKGEEKAQESLDEVSRLFDEDTRMVFIAAGMGGGTGTGGAPVIAKAARDKGLLTVGVVSLPFQFEMGHRVENALKGLMKMRENVDSLIVINDERLLSLYDDEETSMEDALKRCDDVLATATKSIAEIITQYGIVSRDFNDVKTVMEDGGGAMVSVGYASGENRIIKAMNEALQSPMLNLMDIQNAKKLLYIVYTSNEKPVTVSETASINKFMNSLDQNIEVLWGLYRDDSLGDQVKVTIVATGFDKEPSHLVLDDEETLEEIERMKAFYYPDGGVREQRKQELEAVMPQEEVPEVVENGSEPSEEGAVVINWDDDEHENETERRRDNDDDEEDEDELRDDIERLKGRLERPKTWIHKFFEEVKKLMNEEEEI